MHQEHSTLRWLSGAFFALLRPVKGRQNLKSVRSDPHVFVSLPAGLLSEETAKWLGRWETTELNFMWMLWCISWLFCSRHFELKCYEYAPIKSQKHHIKSCLYTRISFCFLQPVHFQVTEIILQSRSEKRTKLKLHTSQATWAGCWLGLKPVRCLHWLFF